MRRDFCICPEVVLQDKRQAVLGLNKFDMFRLLLRIPIRGCSAFSTESETDEARSHDAYFGS